MRLFALGMVFLAGSVALAQDMPLHEILRPGETWKTHSGLASKPLPCDYRVDRAAKKLFRGEQEIKLPFAEPGCCAIGLGGSSLLVGDAADRHVWTFRIEADGSLGPGDRYCRMRTRQDVRLFKKELPVPERSEVSALTVDGANRIYAATAIGIQVFDPTGRICGVMEVPKGTVSSLVFDGDQLFATVNDVVHVRRMNAVGKK